MKKVDDMELENKTYNNKDFDGQISRCSGLLKRKALRRLDNKTVHAEEVTKTDGPFYCSACLSEVIVRKCTEKVDHFAHLARQSPIIRRRDKRLHDECRDQILEYLKKHFPTGKWEKEREIPGNKEKGFKKIIPDISGRINGVPIAIEVQASTYTINRIHEKIIEYQKRTPKVAVLYIIPLFKELGDEPFRPRLFEKYLHSIYYGKVYYWTTDLRTSIIPIHFSPAKRWIQETTWFDTSIGEERTEGGFWLTYRTIKIPRAGNKLDITKDFEKIEREAFQPKNLKKGIPECTIYKDKLNNWWNKNEYENVSKQFEIFKDKPKPEFISNYNFRDEYDDEFYENDSTNTTS